MNRIVLAIVAVAAVAACIVGVVAVAKKSVNDDDANKYTSLMNAASAEDKALFEKTLEEEIYIQDLLSQTDLDELPYDEDILGAGDENFSERHLTSTRNFLEPLPCNNGINFETMACTPLSSLLPSPQNLQISCGACVEVDITDGSTIELPKGLLISGMLRFPPSANVNIRTTSVLVEGFLKIATPSAGNQVKFTLYGLDAVTYTSTEIGSRCAGGCNLGFKPIAVVGGKCAA